MNLTMGSLFDGIGGFPLAAERYGIKTLWASEIEPFPMKVTERRRHPSPLDVLGECSRRVQQRIAQRGGLPYCAGGDHSDP